MHKRSTSRVTSCPNAQCTDYYFDNDEFDNEDNVDVANDNDDDDIFEYLSVWIVYIPTIYYFQLFATIPKLV